jgi:hypothetical protein
MEIERRSMTLLRDKRLACLSVALDKMQQERRGAGKIGQAIQART